MKNKSLSKKYFFSIVIPTLNEEKYLPKILSDLSIQSFRDFEVIVVDGGSEDKTISEALRFKGNFKNLEVLIKSKRDVSYQRNIGGKKAKAEWIIFMDADVRIPFYFLEGVRYRVLQKECDVFTCWCDADSSESSDKAIATFINLNLEVGKAINYPVSLGALIGITSKGFKKLGGFKENFYGEDVEFVGKAKKAGLEFVVFKDPKFILSLRRFRKFGKLKTLRTYAILQLKSLTGIPIDIKKEYPMGGKLDLEKILEDSYLPSLRSNFLEVFKKPKILKKIKSLLELMENGF